MKWSVGSIALVAIVGLVVGLRATQHHGLDCYTQNAYTPQSKRICK
jgi:hypothetical protein